VVSGKNEGVTPGLVIRDSKGRRYFLKFDPKSNPEMASAADAIGSRFFYALGYNTPENYIVTFDRNRLVVDEKSIYSDPRGHKRRMTDGDINDVIAKVPRTRERQYRGLASLIIPGCLVIFGTIHSLIINALAGQTGRVSLLCRAFSGTQQASCSPLSYNRDPKSTGQTGR
jgi:hypothetical protein